MPLREELTPGAYNVNRQPLVQREKILLPTLHKKLGLAKQFVKALKSDSEAIKRVQAMFPKPRSRHQLAHTPVGARED